MTTSAEVSEEGSGRGCPRMVLMAMLPHLLMSTTFFGVSEAYGGSGFPGYPYFLVAVLAVAGFVAWRRDWPLWSGSWAGYWLLALFLLLRVTRLFRWWSSVEMLFPVMIAAAFILIVRRRPLHGLLASMPSLVLLPHIWAFELVAGGNWIWGGLFVLLALTAGAVVWLDSVRAAALLVTGYHLVAGLAISWGKLTLPYHFAEMGARETPQFPGMVNAFVPVTLAVVASSLALLILRALWRVAKQAGPSGRRSEATLVAGMHLTLGAVLWLRSGPASELAVAALVVALSLSLASALALIRSTPAQAQNRLLLLTPLLAVFAPLTILALATPYAPGGAYSSSTKMWIFLSYAGVLLWLSGALWVILSGGAEGADGIRGYAAGGHRILDMSDEVNYSV